eukprot:755259-Hanusia_phi.AAC.4
MLRRPGKGAQALSSFILFRGRNRGHLAGLKQEVSVQQLRVALAVASFLLQSSKVNGWQGSSAFGKNLAFANRFCISQPLSFLRKVVNATRVTCQPDLTLCFQISQFRSSRMSTDASPLHAQKEAFVDAETAADSSKSRDDFRGVLQLLNYRQMLARQTEEIARRRRKGIASTEPEHLIVLVHGLAGTAGDVADDLAYLKRSIDSQDRNGKNTLVYLAKCNEDKTRDGVEAGGWRLAKEIVDLVEGTPSLQRISFVGNSLGGLYSRYAIAVLHQEGRGGWKAEEDLVCGLKPDTFVTTATPHLGVRRFTYLPIPYQLHGLAPVFVGRTGDDLFLLGKEGDEPPLLLLMSTCEVFLRGLRSFTRRRAYANLEGDFLVPFGTAAFMVEDGRAGWGILEKGISEDFERRSQRIRSQSQVVCEMTVDAHEEQVTSDRIRSANGKSDSEGDRSQQLRMVQGGSEVQQPPPPGPQQDLRAGRRRAAASACAVDVGGGEGSDGSSSALLAEERTVIC